MKKLLLAFCITASVAAFAQTQDGKAAIVAQPQLKEGKVVYERTIQLQMRFQGMDPDVDRQMPRSRTDQFELLFSKNGSLWQQLPDANEEANNMSSGGGEGRGNMFRMMIGGSDVVYNNFTTGTSTAQRELNSKTYLVEDSVKKLSWKITDETKNILGYTARKAVAQRIGTRTMMAMENGEMKRQQVADTANIVAWFTFDILVPAGPEFQGQLPGLILELEMNKGRMVYKAVEVSPKVSVAAIKEPKAGKRISADDFNKEREKMFEEMRKNMPAMRGGGREIRIMN